MKPKFSIIIPVKALNAYIYESVPRILNLEYKLFEILIFPDELPQSLPSWKQTIFIPSGSVGPAVKRNLALKHASGEILAFLDDDAYPDKYWLSRAVKVFQNPRISAIGGPNLTPEDNSFRQWASGLFFASRFGAGAPMRYQSGSRELWIDDWPTVNFLIRKRVFKDIGGFAPKFWPGEDTKLCLDVVKKGGKILYHPQIIVYHHRRSTLKSHLKQIVGYGFHRGYFARKFPQTSLRLVYLIPSIFLLYLCWLVFGLLFVDKFSWLWFAPIFLYIGVLLIETLKVNKGWRVRLLLPVYFLVSHLAYGANFFRGFLYFKPLKSKLR